MPLVSPRPWGCENCGYPNQHDHQECRYCGHRKTKGRYILYPRTRSHQGLMIVDNEKFGVYYHLWESEAHGEEAEGVENSVILFQPGIDEGEGARPDEAWTIDFEKLGKQPALSDFVLPKQQGKF